jgi:predicted nucleic acid-binding protein
MAEIWVVNASPLISLDRTGSIDILLRLARDLVIPAGVLAEIARGPSPIAPSQLGMHRAVSVPTIHPVVAAWDLGTGESEVLSWAVANPEATALLDDRAARRCAAALNIPTRGTLHVVIEAKRSGVVPAVAPLIDRLRNAGLYLSDALVRSALEAAGEGHD